MIERMLRTMLSSSVYGDADATEVNIAAADVGAAPAWPTGAARPNELPAATSGGGSGPFVVVGIAFAVGIVAAQWIAWKGRR
jgi:hypothetical protein